MNETSLMHRILERVGKGAVRLFRNNVGALPDGDGRIIYYGVCNPGGSDLIGWKSVVVTPDMVGKRVAIFVAGEVKVAGRRATQAQQNFLRNVEEAGGIAGVLRSEDDAERLLT